jgi:hypothetical protein
MYQTIENELQRLLADYGVSSAGDDTFLIEALEGVGQQIARGCYPPCGVTRADMR